MRAAISLTFERLGGGLLNVFLLMLASLVTEPSTFGGALLGPSGSSSASSDSLSGALSVLDAKRSKSTDDSDSVSMSVATAASSSALEAAL